MYVKAENKMFCIPKACLTGHCTVDAAARFLRLSAAGSVMLAICALGSSTAAPGAHPLAHVSDNDASEDRSDTYHA